MKYKLCLIITISREFGSGGHTIAMKTAEFLNIPFYDEEIVSKIAKESGFTMDFITEKGEYFNSVEQFSNNFILPMAKIGWNMQDEIFNMQKKIILEISTSPCVIVGRCADYILEQAGAKILKVFIHADDTHRLQRIEQRYGKTDVPTVKRLHDKDKSRKAYYKYYTDMEWGNYQNYHLNLDSGYLGEDECAAIITRTAKRILSAQIR